MELSPNQDLQKTIFKCQPEVDLAGYHTVQTSHARYLIYQIVQEVQFLHGLGIAHCNFKLNNIVLF